MKPEQIRAMYDQESAAGLVEAGETLGNVLGDPEMARMYIRTVAALAPTDKVFTLLFQLFCEALHVHADELIDRLPDDAFALGAAATMIGLMEAMKPGSHSRAIKAADAARVLRGRPKDKPKGATMTEKLDAIGGMAGLETIDRMATRMQMLIPNADIARDYVRRLVNSERTHPAYIDLYEYTLLVMHTQPEELESRLADDAFAIQACGVMLVMMETILPGSVSQPIIDWGEGLRVGSKHAPLLPVIDQAMIAKVHEAAQPVRAFIQLPGMARWYLNRLGKGVQSDPVFIGLYVYLLDVMGVRNEEVEDRVANDEFALEMAACAIVLLEIYRRDGITPAMRDKATALLSLINPAKPVRSA